MASFLGVTAHYIRNWKLKSSVLACRRFPEKHTSENIAQSYENVIDFYDIASKIDFVITDNAANMVKAFETSLPGFYEEVNNDALEEDELLELDVHEKTESDVLNFITQRLSCAAHSLQLVIKDALKENKEMEKTLCKISALISSIRKSTTAMETLARGEINLQPANVTRWNSQLRMITSITRGIKKSELCIQEAIKSLPGDKRLTAIDLNTIEELIEVLEPFEDATDALQGEAVVTVSKVIPSIIGLKHKLDDLLNKRRYCSGLVLALKRSLMKRMENFERNSIYILAAVLDPRFKISWCDPVQALHIKEIVITKLKSESNVVEREMEDEQDSCNIEPPPPKRSKLFSFIDQNVITKKVTKKSSPHILEKEVEDYLAEELNDEDSDPLEFWKKNNEKFPHLYKVAGKFLSICASSAPVERLFSVAGKFYSPTRTLLKAENFENLILIKMNKRSRI